MRVEKHVCLRLPVDRVVDAALPQLEVGDTRLALGALGKYWRRRMPATVVGITGTGVVGLISQGLKAHLIHIPRINTADTEIHLPNGIKFTEKDLLEAGKAIGSVRAGHITLCQEAGIQVEDIETAYMSGASGTYVDALKAQDVGMIPARVKKIYQVGNTSLAMARDIVRDVEHLWNMKRVADDLRQHHCMFAESKVFEKVYILELSYWTEGMPISQSRSSIRLTPAPRRSAGHR